MVQDPKKEEKQEEEIKPVQKKEKKAEEGEITNSKQKADVVNNKDREITELKLKVEEYLSGWQRAQADYQNLTKETERRIGEICRHATAEFIYELLPLVDHFKYAFRAIPEKEQNTAWVIGIKHIQDNFLKILEQHGVKVVETKDRKFDPQLHEAIGEMEGNKDQSGLIAEEVASGFIFNGKVIRVAKVKIYK